MQTIRERKAFQPRVIIGSKYYGPRLDRPALRQMPRSWRLSEGHQPKAILGDWVLGAVAWILALFIIVQTVCEVLGWL